jgi:aryl-alcohol dehydrogenase-like predicted oxidoreductase
MKELQDEGKIAHFGLSEVGMEQIAAARASTYWWVARPRSGSLS